MRRVFLRQVRPRPTGYLIQPDYMEALGSINGPQVSLSFSFISCHFTARSRTSVNSCCKYPVPPPSLSFSSRVCGQISGILSISVPLFFFILCCSRVVRQMLWAEQQVSPEQCFFQVHLSASRSDRLKPRVSSVSLSICQEESSHC